MWLGSSQLHLDELFSPAIAGILPPEGGTINIVELIRSADTLQKLQMQLEKMHLCRVSSFAVYGSGRGSAMTWWYVHCFALFHNVLHADVLSNVLRDCVMFAAWFNVKWHCSAGCRLAILRLCSTANALLSSSS